MNDIDSYAVSELEHAVDAQLKRLRDAREQEEDRCFWEILTTEKGEYRLLATVYDDLLFGDELLDDDPHNPRYPTWRGFIVRKKPLRQKDTGPTKPIP